MRASLTPRAAHAVAHDLSPRVGAVALESTTPTTCPHFADPPRPRPPRRGALARRPDELLAFCGGGKDSLVALKLLERAGLPFATLGYAHSIYGNAAHQHALLDRVAARHARARAPSASG